MKYISTRNSKKTFSFKDVFLNALAPDGGLFVPQNIPNIRLLPWYHLPIIKEKIKELELEIT